MCDIISVSSLGKTWVLDLDGTIVKHNGYKLDGHDTLLPGIERLISQISENDMVIIVTSRSEEFRTLTEHFLKQAKIRYNHIIYGAPYGERILINDEKPSGMKTAVALNTKRDEACETSICIDLTL